VLILLRFKRELVEGEGGGSGVSELEVKIFKQFEIK
jgi:hypothetical protein